MPWQVFDRRRIGNSNRNGCEFEFQRNPLKECACRNSFRAAHEIEFAEAALDCCLPNSNDAVMIARLGDDFAGSRRETRVAESKPNEGLRIDQRGDVYSSKPDGISPKSGAILAENPARAMKPGAGRCFSTGCMRATALP